MKKTSFAIVLLAGAVTAYSQGTINWSDYIPSTAFPPGFSITVFSPGPGGVEENLGNTDRNDIPSGNATYSGVPLGAGQGGDSGPTGYANGFNYTIGLYVGTSLSAVQSAVQSGQPIATDNFAAGSGGWDFSGTLIATLPTETGFAPGDQVYAELAAWYSASGATNYAEAVANGLTNDPAGFSSISTAITLGGPNQTATLAGSGITDFSLATTTTPEPNTFALGLFGASALLAKMRRKK